MAQGQDAIVIQCHGIPSLVEVRAIPLATGLTTQAPGSARMVRAILTVHAYFETFHFHITRPSAPRSAYRFIVLNQPWGSCRHTS